MSLPEYELIKSDRFSQNPIGLLPDFKQLLSVRESESPYTLQQSYLLAAYFRSLLGLGRYSEADKKLVLDLLQKFPSVNTQTQGSFMNFELSDRAIKFMLDTKEALTLEISTNVLQLMTMWLSEMPDLQKQRDRADFDLFDKLNALLNRLNAFNHVEDRVVLLSVIYKDVVELLPEWVKLPQALQEPTDDKIELKLESSTTATSSEPGIPRPQQLASALAFLSQSLPKLLYNVLIRAEAFAKDMLLDSRPEYDLLYLNETLDHLLSRSANFCQLSFIVLSALVRNFKLVQFSQQPLLLDLTFRFYYAYHKERKADIYSLLLSALDQLANPVRYALTQEVMLFMTIVDKLGHRELYSAIKGAVPWVKDLVEKSPPMASPKNMLDPLFGSEIELTVPRGARTIRVIEVYREYSLVYFDVQCRSADIGVRFVYAGAFNSHLQENRTIFERERLKFKDSFKGSVEVILPGIYYFEFDNSYSWLTSKTIAYRTVVLSCMEIDAPTEVSYLRFIRSQLALKKDKQLRLSRYQRLPNVQMQSDALCEVFFERDSYRLLITATTKDNYEYELQGADKNTVADKLLARIHKYFSTRNYSQTKFKLGDVHIVSLKEFTNDLKEAVQRGTFLTLGEKLQRQKQQAPPTKPEDTLKESVTINSTTEVKQLSNPLQPKHIEEVDHPKKSEGAATAAYSEEMTEVTEETLD